MALRSATRPGAAAVLAAAVLAACARQAPPPPPPPTVGYVTVEPTQAALTTELPGRTSAYLQSDVRPQVNGVIRARTFTEGGEVRAGQVLYEIDPAPYKALYDQAKATLANAKAAAATARLKAERYADLVKINAVSKQDFDDARAAGLQADATVAQSRAALEAAAINLAYTRIKAPISGRIGRSAVTPGALAVSGQTTALATIQALDPIYVDLSQSADEVLRLKGAAASGGVEGPGAAGARVRLTLSDGGRYPLEGQLRFSEAVVDPATGSVTLRAVFPNPKALLLPGMFVRAEIEEAVAPKAILAPERAVSRNEKGQPTAYVVGPDGKAELRVLTAPRTVGTSWLVTSGLKPGDRLIVDGLLSVRAPGQKVHAVPAASTPSPAASGGAS